MFSIESGKEFKHIIIEDTILFWTWHHNNILYMVGGKGVYALGFHDKEVESLFKLYILFLILLAIKA